jgi:Fur family peroxide stress response transcriptional regulator
VARWCTIFSQECRRRGIRLTAQRLAIYRALACDATHPTADAIYAALREEVSGLSRATVYRMLESLQLEGFVRRVSTVDGIARYDANLVPHQHLVCRQCRSILDTGGEWLRPPELPRRGPAGFIPEMLDLCIIGICARCRRSGERRGDAN